MTNVKTETKTATVRARIEPEIKKRAESILKTLGMSSSEAINVFYNKIVIESGIPFSLQIPNSETREAISEIRGKKNSDSHTFNEWKKSLENE